MKTFNTTKVANIKKYCTVYSLSNTLIIDYYTEIIIMSDTKSVTRAYEHLIELLEELGIDQDIIHATEQAYELFEETYGEKDDLEEES
jgi:hypothetical protein